MIIALIFVLIGAVFLFGGVSATLKNTSTIVACEACGMLIDKTNASAFRIVDANGTEHWGCCPICGEVVGLYYNNSEIYSHCYVMGSEIKMTVVNRTCTSVLVTPSNPSDNVTIVLGGSCATNKIVSNVADGQSVIHNNEWASNASLKTVKQSFAAAGKKLAAMTVGYKPVNVPSLNFVMIGIGVVFLGAAPASWALLRRRVK